MRPTFFVFCEGKSEEAYVKYLRSKYRLPIDIDPNIVGLKISNRYIANYKQGKDIDSTKDKDFLMYDLDRSDILPKLQLIKGAIIITSNPCFELWYLLHFKNQTTELTSKECNNLLLSHNKNYSKGAICSELFDTLSNEYKNAISRAKKLTANDNPSTEIYKFIEELENVEI